MKKLLLLALSVILFTACAQAEKSEPVVDDSNSKEIANEQGAESFIFGRVSYELDYPSTWTHAEEAYDSGALYTQFYDEKEEKTMMVDCDWQGGMEAEKLKSDERTFEKQGEQVKASYTVFGTQENIGNGNISLGLLEWSEEKSQDFYCKIFFEPQVADTSIMEEIFSSIR